VGSSTDVRAECELVRESRAEVAVWFIILVREVRGEFRDISVYSDLDACAILRRGVQFDAGVDAHAENGCEHDISAHDSDRKELELATVADTLSVKGSSR